MLQERSLVNCARWVAFSGKYSIDNLVQVGDVCGSMNINASMTTIDRFDLEKQFTFYASYHHNHMNKLIHMFCIWPILGTFIILLAHTDPIVSQPEAVRNVTMLQEYMIFNWSFLAVMIYVPWYIVLDWW